MHKVKLWNVRITIFYSGNAVIIKYYEGVSVFLPKLSRMQIPSSLRRIKLSSVASLAVS